MKKFKAILTTFLIFSLLLTMFAACNSAGEQPEGNNSDSNISSQAPSSTNDPIDEEIVELTMAYYDINEKADTCGDMVKAFNEITESKIGVRLDLQPISVGKWSTTVSLMLAGKEKLDIIVGQLTSDAISYSTLKNNNQLLDISSYLKEDYAKGILDTVGSLLGPFTDDDGKIYGMPSKRDTAAYINIVMRKDILEEMDLLEEAQNISTWAEYEQILYNVKESYNEAGMYAVTNNDHNNVIALRNWLCSSVPERGAFNQGSYCDIVGDVTKTVCVDFDGNVSLLPENSSAIAHWQMVSAWMSDGLLYPDAAFTEATGRTLMRDGVGFSCLNNGEGQLANDFRNATGYDVVCIPIYPRILATNETMGWGAMIPINCEEPEKAVQLLSLLYTDKELINLLTYGIEGEDYELTDEGEAAFTVADMKWKGSDWLVGNMFLTWPQAGTGGDYRERRLKIVEAQEVSPFYGFLVDTKELQLVISQISAVNDQYIKTLDCGGYTDEIHAEYLEKLQTAGVQDYLDAVQTQLDAWRSGQ